MTTGEFTLGTYYPPASPAAQGGETKPQHRLVVSTREPDGELTWRSEAASEEFLPAAVRLARQKTDWVAADARPLPQDKKPRRIRLPNLAKVERENPGKTVTEITYRRDGSRTFVLDAPEAPAQQAARSEDPPRRSMFKARAVPRMKVVL